MKRVSTITTALCAVLVLGLTACQQTTTTAEAPEPDTSEFRDSGIEEPPPPPPPKLELGTIYFDFDRSDIREDARVVLRKNAEMLRETGANMTVEGHTDERGDEEYNLALGERRANSVKKYLVNLGVGSGQLRTISYGEAKPAVVGHNEEAWQWNRRAEFVER
jgi:peptidoglycan-associated lipoprotein